MTLFKEALCSTTEQPELELIVVSQTDPIVQELEPEDRRFIELQWELPQSVLTQEEFQDYIRRKGANFVPFERQENILKDNEGTAWRIGSFGSQSNENNGSLNLAEPESLLATEQGAIFLLAFMPAEIMTVIKQRAIDGKTVCIKGDERAGNKFFVRQTDDNSEALEIFSPDVINSWVEENDVQQQRGLTILLNFC